MKTRTIIDPPMGSRYGFPKEYDKNEDETQNEWLLRNGYPQHIIDAHGDYFWCRFWYENIDE